MLLRTSEKREVERDIHTQAAAGATYGMWTVTTREQAAYTANLPPQTPRSGVTYFEVIAHDVLMVIRLLQEIDFLVRNLIKLRDVMCGVWVTIYRGPTDQKETLPLQAFF